LIALASRTAGLRAYAVAAALTAAVVATLPHTPPFARTDPTAAAASAAASPATAAAPAGALPAARRFLVLYARAYAAQLDAAERAELRRVSTAAIAEVLLEQPPDERLAGGRVDSLLLGELDRRDWMALARLSFIGLRTSAMLVLGRSAGGGWRVTRFEPGA